MKRTLTIVLTNGTEIHEEVPEVAKDADNETVLGKLAEALYQYTQEGVPCIIHGGQLLSINQIVEAYVQES